MSHRFHSAPICHGQTDERNWSSKTQHYALTCISRQKHTKIVHMWYPAILY